MKQAAASPRQFTGWHMLTIMVVFFGVVISVNAALAILANTTWPGLIVNNGYDASQNYGKEEAREKAQALLGWRAEVVHKGNVLTVTFRDGSGQPLAGLKVSGVLRRPVTDRQDTPLAFSEAVGGNYSAPAAVAPGVWEVEVDAADPQGHSFTQAYRFTAQAE